MRRGEVAMNGTPMMPDPSMVPRRSYVDEFVSDGECLLYSPASDQASVLNRTGTEIWQLCDGTRSIRSIARTLAERYGVDEGLLLDDIAVVDKIEYTSLPPARIGNPRGPGAGNPLIIRAYTFIPKNLDRSKKQPLIVFAHQGVHANQDTRDAHVRHARNVDGDDDHAVEHAGRHDDLPRDGAIRCDGTGPDRAGGVGARDGGHGAAGRRPN